MEVEAGADQMSAETAEVTEASETKVAQAGTVSPQIDIEARAYRMGWRPKDHKGPDDNWDQYKGLPEKWIPAEQYIEVATESMPVLRKTLRTMDDKFAKQERLLADLAENVKYQRDNTHKAEQRAYDRARAELVAERDAAIAQADVSAVKAVDAKIAEHETTKPAEAKKADPPAETQTTAPEVSEWLAANAWFNTDDQLRSLAQGTDSKLIKDEPGLSLTERLAKVKAEVQRRFPEKFGMNTRRQAPSVVGSSNGAPPRPKNEKSYDNLPAEAKKACDKLVVQMKSHKKPFTRDEYVANYEWPE